MFREVILPGKPFIHVADIYAYMSYGLNLGWGGPTGDYIGLWGGDLLRDILQI